MAKTKAWRVLLAGVLVLALCFGMLTACKPGTEQPVDPSDNTTTTTTTTTTTGTNSIDPNAPVDVTFTVTLDKALEEGVVLYLAGSFHLVEGTDTWAEDLRLTKDEADPAGLTYTLVQSIVPGTYAYNFALGTEEGMDWNAKCDQGKDADLTMEVSAEKNTVSNALTFSAQPDDEPKTDGFDMKVTITLSKALHADYTLFLGGNFYETKDNWPAFEMKADSGRKVFTVTVEDVHKVSSMPYTVYWSTTKEVDWNKKLYEGTFNTTKAENGTYSQKVTNSAPDPSTVFDMKVTLNLSNALPSGRTLWISGNFSGDDENWDKYLCTKSSSTKYTVTVPSAQKAAEVQYKLFSSTSESDADILWEQTLFSGTFNTTKGSADTYTATAAIKDFSKLFDMKVTVNLSSALPAGYTLWINGNFDNEAEWRTAQLKASADRKTFTVTIPDTVKMDGMQYDIYYAKGDEVDWNNKIHNGTFNVAGGTAGTANVNFTAPDPNKVFDMKITVNLTKPLAAGNSLFINGNFFESDQWSTYRLNKVSDTQYTVTIPNAHKAAFLEYGLYPSTTEWKDDIIWEPPLIKTSFDASKGAESTYTVTVP